MATLSLSLEDRFPASAASAAIKTCLAARLKGVQTYSTETTRELSDEIRELMKGLNAPRRYRFIVQVVVGEAKGQGVRFAKRALWDTSTDAFASATFEGDTLFAIGVCFAVFSH